MSSTDEAEMVKAASAELLKNAQFLEMMQKAMGDEAMPAEGDPKREDWLKRLQQRLHEQQMEQQKRQIEQPVKDAEGEWMWIVPEAGFCIKASTVKKNKKIFINVCKHPRIAEPIPLAHDEADPDMKDAIKYKIPLSCGAARPDQDKKGAPCVVYDVVVNPATIERCGKENDFRRFVAALCMTWIQQKSEPELDADQFTNVNIKCKGQPQMQRIRLAPPPPAGAAAETGLGSEIKLPPSTSGGSVPTRAATSVAKPLVMEITQEEPKPTFEIKHEGNYDWSKHAQPTKNAYFREVVPVLLHVSVVLPTVQTIKEVEVQLQGREIRFIYVDNEEGKPFFTLTLPFPVEEEPRASKFHRTTKTLSLTLVVSLPNEMEDEERRQRLAKEALESETAEEKAKRLAQEKLIAERRERMERIEREEKEVMQQRKALVENMEAVREGRIPPELQKEIDDMPSEQAAMMLNRISNRVKRGDSVDKLFETLPEDVLENICRHIRDRLGLAHPEPKKKAPEPALPPTPAVEAPKVDMEFNFAKKAENLFGVKLMNRYVFALEH